jgi:hypothetical protein
MYVYMVWLHYTQTLSTVELVSCVAMTLSKCSVLVIESPVYVCAGGYSFYMHVHVHVLSSSMIIVTSVYMYLQGYSLRVSACENCICVFYSLSG